MKKQAGTAYVKVAGDLIELSGNISASLTNRLRETITGVNAIHYKETVVAAFIEIDVFNREINLQKLEDNDSLTIQLEMNNGRRGLLRDAVLAGEHAVDGIEGTVSLRFEGTGEWK